jgi:hypothetical protein
MGGMATLSEALDLARVMRLEVWPADICIRSNRRISAVKRSSGSKSAEISAFLEVGYPDLPKSEQPARFLRIYAGVLLLRLVEF